jgi:xanthine dehydrogenase molybdenum-binding subunit
VGAVTVDRLSFRYQPAAGEVLKNISFTVEKGEIVALLGLSGCGKSTICQCLGGIIPHFAEVEVDTETGQVKVIRVAAAHDVGKAINPVIVEGQIEGGVLQGVGYAVSEEIVHDAKGRPLHNSLHKYLLPTAEDIPEIDAIIVEASDPSGPFGAKGVGETGLVPTAGAIANAVYNATGVRFYEIPMTEEKVFRALSAAKNSTC